MWVSVVFAAYAYYLCVCFITYYVCLCHPYIKYDLTLFDWLIDLVS